MAQKTYFIISPSGKFALNRKFKTRSSCWLQGDEIKEAIPRWMLK